MGSNGRGVSNRMGWRIENGPEIGYWVANQLGSAFFEEKSVAIGLLKDDKIVAGIIYENWNGTSWVVHIAATDRLTPSFVAAICDYPFNTCNAHKAIAPVQIGNLKSVKLVTKMGFLPEATLKDCHPDGDIVLYTLKKSDCRFLEGRYGKKCANSSGPN
jgi:hypothetical protein